MLTFYLRFGRTSTIPTLFQFNSVADSQKQSRNVVIHQPKENHTYSYEVSHSDTCPPPTKHFI